MPHMSGENERKCPHCGEDLEWEPREEDLTPTDDPFGYANELLRQAARDAAHKQMESDYHASKSRVAELEVELLGARAEARAAKIESARLRAAAKKRRG